MFHTLEGAHIHIYSVVIPYAGLFSWRQELRQSHCLASTVHLQYLRTI